MSDFYLARCPDANGRWTTLSLQCEAASLVEAHARFTSRVKPPHVVEEIRRFERQGWIVIWKAGEPVEEHPRTTCRRCDRTSFNPGDIDHRYCDACNQFY